MLHPSMNIFTIPHPNRRFNLWVARYLLWAAMYPLVTFGQSSTFQIPKIPKHTTFETEDYGAGIQNWDISQDPRGLMYVANNQGMLEYDGSLWRTYQIDNNTRTRSVFADIDGRIYVGGQNQFGYFESDEYGSLNFFSLYDSLPPNQRSVGDIWKIIKHQGQVIFCSFQGAIILENGRVSKPEADKVFYLAFKSGNKLYALTKKGIAEWDGKHLTTVLMDTALDWQKVTGMAPLDQSNTLITFKSGKVYRFNGSSMKPWKTPLSAPLKDASINCVRLLKDHRIAIGTQNDGLYLLNTDGSLSMHLTEGKGLPNRTILCLYEDNYGHLWAGLNNGLAMVELNSPFSLINNQSNLPGTGYGGLKTSKGVYLGTSNGLYKDISDSFKLIPGSAGQVYNIQALDDKVLLSHHRGLFEIKSQKAHPIFTQTGSWKVDQFTADSWILGTYEGFFKIQSRGEGYTTQILGQFEESSRVFEYHSPQALFMSHGYQGVYKVDFPPQKDSILAITHYGEENGFPSNLLINVFDLGNELVFPAQTGIYAYQASEDRFIIHPRFDSLFPEGQHISEMVSDLNGNVYFIADEQAGVLIRDQFGQYTKETSIFLPINKYLSDDLENISILDAANILFGAKQGFVHYNPEKNQNLRMSFACYLRKATVSMQDTLRTVYNGGTWSAAIPEFRGNLPSIRFTYAAPYFNDKEDTHYRYRLEGFEDQWSQWTSETSKEYTNLSENTYTFHVQAKNVFGTVSETASFDFTVFPPWHRSYVAILAYLLLASGAFGLFVYLRDLKHRREKHAMATSKKLELMRKDRELRNVSEASQEEIEKLKTEKLKAEIDYKNRELTSTAMHLVNKNEFLLSIRDTIKDLPKTPSPASLKKIIKDIDRNMSEDDDWKQFTSHFDQVHGSFLENIKAKHPTLTPQEIKLCAYLRMNMTSKDIANLLNISVRGVEIGRYRLRKKLGLSRETNLVDYMHTFD